MNRPLSSATPAPVAVPAHALSSLVIDKEHPWPWLDAFPESAQDFFNGRDEDVRTLLGCVLAAPATVLFGKSGLGKTSLVQAGLSPQLRLRRLLPVLLRLEHGSEVPVSAQLLNKLQVTVQAAGLRWVGPPLPEADVTPVGQLWELLHDTATALVDEDGRRWAPVFVLDQFEEVFTLVEDPRRRERIFAELGDLIEGRIPPEVARRLDFFDDLLDRIDPDRSGARFVLSLREDYLPDLEVWADRIPRLGPNRCRLLPMAPQQALAAVQITGGTLVTQGDARRIVEFLGLQGAEAGRQRTQRERWIEPALLSLICAGLNQHRLDQTPPPPRLDTRTLDSLGSELLERFYNDAFAALPTEHRARAEAFVERELITADGTRRPFPREAAAQFGLSGADLAQLIHKRLLRVENTEAGDFVELVHDRLAVIAAQRAHQAKERAEQAAREAERQQADERRRQRQRVWIAMAVALLLVVSTGAGLAFWQWTKAEAAREQAEAAKATAEQARNDALVDRAKALDAERRAKASAAEAEAQATQAKAEARRAMQAEGQAKENLDRAMAAETRSRQLARDAQRLAAEAREQAQVAQQRASEAHAARVAAEDALFRAQKAETKAVLAQRAATVDRLVSDSHRLLNGQEGGSYELAVQVLAVAHQLRPGNSPALLGNAPLKAEELAAGFKWQGNAGSEITSLAFSPDGLRVITGHEDRTLRLWDARTGQGIGLPWVGHTHAVYAVAFSADGLWVASGSKDGSVRIWNTQSGQPLSAPLRVHAGAVTSVAFNTDHTRLASGGHDGHVRLWNTQDLDAIALLPASGVRHGSRVSSLAFSPDGAQLVSSSADRTLRLWDGRMGTSRGVSLTGHEASVTAVAYSPNGRQVASASADHQLRLWDAQTGAQVGRPLRGHAAEVSSLAFSPDGTRLYSGSHDHTLRMWSTTTGTLQGELATDHAAPINHLALSPEGARLAYASGSTLQLWNVGGSELPLVAISGATRVPVAAVATHPKLPWAVSADVQGQLQVWRLDSGRLGVALSAPVQAHEGPAFSVAVTRDGLCVASGGRDGTIRLWHWHSERQQLEPLGEPIRAHRRAVNSLAFSPDGRWLVSGGEDRSVKLWDAQSHQAAAAPLKGHDGPVYAVAFNTDGRQVASGSKDGTVRLWAWNGQEARLSNTLTTTAASPVISLAYSPLRLQGVPLLVAGTRNGEVQRWNASTGHAIGQPLLGHDGAINSVTFSPNGELIASGGADRLVRQWRALSGEPHGAPLMGHTEPIHTLAYNPDGTQLVSAGQDRGLRIWATGALRNPWQELLCANARGDLGDSAWRRWISADLDYVMPCSVPALPAEPAVPLGLSPVPR